MYKIPAEFRQPAFNYRFKFVNASDLNALALPGGPMYVDRGMVEAARKVLDFERVYAGIIAIGIAAFLFRFLLTFLESKLFPWRKAAGALAGAGAAVPSATTHLKVAKHGA